MDFDDSTKGDIISKVRDAPPSHYLLKIESFALLSQAPAKKYTSDAFDAGGYKWKLLLYPNGDKQRNGEGHISIYLELMETSSLPAGWEIIVTFNFFIFNLLMDKYFTIGDGRLRRFHALKTRCGINKFMDLGTFCDPINGFLIKDTCVFGAEVFVVRSNFKGVIDAKDFVSQNYFKGECLSMMIKPITYYHTWPVDNYSFLLCQNYLSESFGFYKWKISLHASGNRENEGNYISLYLSCAWSSVPPNTKLFVKYILRVKEQKNGKHIENKATILLAPSTIPTWGFPKFMSLATLKDPNQGYLVDETCIIEAEVTLLGLVLNLS